MDRPDNPSQLTLSSFQGKKYCGRGPIIVDPEVVGVLLGELAGMENESNQFFDLLNDKDKQLQTALSEKNALLKKVYKAERVAKTSKIIAFTGLFVALASLVAYLFTI
jgi:t-SNARE complex subunit (syntaxin)